MPEIRTVETAEDLAQVLQYMLNARRPPEAHELFVTAYERGTTGKVTSTLYDDPGVEIRHVPGEATVQVMFGRPQDENPEANPPTEAVEFRPDFTITVTEG